MSSSHDLKKLQYDGKDIVSEVAVRDDQGRIISSTYVDKTTDQTITGLKRFDTTPQIFDHYEITTRNLFRKNFNIFDNTGGTGTTYAYFKLPDDGKDYILSVRLKDSTKSFDSGNVFGWTTNGGTAGGSLGWLASGDTILSQYHVFLANDTARCISLYYGNERTFNQLLARYYIQLEEGTTMTEYVDPDSGVENIYVNAAKVNDIPTNVSQLSNDSGFITINDVPQEIYWCTYGTTTYAEVTQALNDGKLPVALDGKVYYIYSGTWSQFYTFSRLYNINYTNAYSIYLNSTDNSWSRSGGVGLERTSNKATSISSSSTDVQYPSAKCVYDNIEAAKSLIPDNTDYVDLTTNQIINGQKDFYVVPRVKVEHTVHNLPDIYQEVEYLESTGTQYIDTGVVLTNLHAVEIDYQLTSTQQTNRRGLYGILSTNAASRFGSLFSPTNYQLEHGYGLTNTYWQQGLPDTNRHLLKQDKNITYMDGVAIHTFNEATFTTTGNALLGNFNYTNYIPALAKYYESKWWNDGVLIRDFIPCYRKSDDKPGYYDIVNNTFYTNAGTGEFVLGPNVEPITYENLLTDANVPSMTSQLINDSGFITASYHDSTKANQSSLDAVTAKIPTEASSSNQLADKAFVNSSIVTATATFRGTYTTLQDLQATSGDLNDYAFYNHTDEVGNTVFDRYKYIDTTPHWVYEYTLNNSSFTAAQWAAINSGVTADAWVNTSSAQVINGQKDFNVIPRVRVTHETHNLPDTYQEVEYIESSGTQYIDSNYIPNANTKIIFDSIMGVNGVSDSVRQGRKGDNQRLSIAIVSNKLEFAIGGYQSVNLNVAGQRHLFELDVPSRQGKLDDIVYATFSSTAWTSEQTLYFFGRHMDSGVDGLGNTRNYNIKIYEQDQLIREYIPCYRLADDVIGMYDIVNNVFYTNAGTETFAKGSDIAPVTYESLLTDANFSPVAFSGNYNELINKPTIPAVNNGMLTIQKNGTTIATFGANQSTSSTANIIVPTKTSDLINDSDFVTNITANITESQVINLTDDLQNIREVAEGKTKSFVVDDTINPLFNSQADTITVATEIIDNNGNTITLDNTNIGDVFFVLQTDVPDRWISNYGGRLPEEYQEVEYIEADSHCCITLPLVMSSAIDIETKFSIVDSLTTTKWFLGGATWQGIHINGDGQVGFTSGSGTTNKIYITPTTNEPIVLKTDGNDIYFNDMTTKAGTITRASYGTTPSSLFCYNSTNMNCAGRIYYFKIFENGQLKNYLIPCYRISDNEKGLYDLKTATFYTNSSSGTMSSGSSVTPERTSFKLSKLETVKLPITTILSTVPGYNANKTQTLKNINGTFTWVDD